MLACINFSRKGHEINSILCKYILNIFQKAVEEPLNGMWLLQVYKFFLIHYEFVII